MILASPRFGHPHSQNPSCMGIPVAIWVRVTGDARITRVLWMGCPKCGDAHITVTAVSRIRHFRNDKGTGPS